MPPIPDKLADNVPELVVLLLIVAAVLAFALRLLARQAQQMGGVLQRMADRHESAVTRHEDAEERQFAAVALQTAAIEAQTKSNEVQTRTLDVLARTVERLADHIDRADPLFHLSHETHAMTDNSSPEFRVGLPPGHESPDEILGRSRVLGEQLPWTHEEFGITALYDAGVRGKGATVVVIDTGTDVNHGDLKTNTDAAKSKSYTGEALADGNGHGTHCCGIVAADDNAAGVRGVAPDATVIAVKGLSNRGSGYGSWLASAIRYAADLPGHKILSMSFGAAGEDPEITAAIKYAHGRGCWLFAAAGNSGPGSINWPGALDEVVCVASTDKGGGVSSYSSANEFVDVGFGGRDILSTYPGNRLATLSGTSMATPGVAGVAALAVGELLKAGKPVPDQEAMKKVLFATCSNPAGRNVYTGYGLVQPAKFVEAMVKDGSPVEPPKPVHRVAVPPGAKFLVFEM